MCSSCGCGESGDQVTIRKPGEEHDHHHDHSHDGHTHDDDGHLHPHEHDHRHSHAPFRGGHTHDPNDHYHYSGRVVQIEEDIMAKNNLLGERNRGYFEAKNILALNLVSSPGSGKTTLLERTIRDLGGSLKLSIIEGDQQTMNDANRIASTGAPVVQINTGVGCHLDAGMINNALKKLNPPQDSILFIENVGNLVCPSLFDLGEKKRVVIISVTEGEDKPVKYPTMFQSSHLCLINKTDLSPYVDFNMKQARDYALQVNRSLKIIELSAKTGEGMERWYDWIRKELA